MLRQFLRHNYLSVAGHFKSPATGIHIMNGHYVSRMDLDQNVFYDLLKKLRKEIEFVRIEEAVELVSNKTISKKPLMAFTFDDGFTECYTKIAPVLEQFNTNAAFFINPGFVNGDDDYIKNFQETKVLVEKKFPMNWKQIVELHKKGHVIGSHTIDHVRLTITDEAELLQQIKKCKEIIQEQLNGACEYFAYPYGQLNDINEKALKIAIETYKYVFSGANYKNYFSFDGTVINRRHFEGDWHPSHINYFLSFKKFY